MKVKQLNKEVKLKVNQPNKNEMKVKHLEKRKIRENTAIIMQHFKSMNLDFVFSDSLKLVVVSFYQKKCDKGLFKDILLKKNIKIINVLFFKKRDWMPYCIIRK